MARHIAHSLTAICMFSNKYKGRSIVRPFNGNRTEEGSHLYLITSPEMYDTREL